jgi:hypothetical protein
MECLAEGEGEGSVWMNSMKYENISCKIGYQNIKYEKERIKTD